MTPVPARAAWQRVEKMQEVRQLATIFVVEDEERVRRVAERILKKQGYSVVVAGSIEEAMRMCGNGRMKIDLLFTDVVMPDGTGSHLAHSLQQIYPHCKILYTSGYVDDAKAQEGISKGKIDFLPKPYSPDDLVIKIRELLGSGTGSNRVA